MSQTLDLGNTEHIVFDGKEVLTLVLNGQTIWGSVPADSLIMNCSSTYIADVGNSTEVSAGYNLHFNINAIEDVTITFNEFATTIPAGTSQIVKVCDAESEQQTGDLNIVGKCEFKTKGYSYIATGGTSIQYYLPLIVNSIKQWTTTQDAVQDSAFMYSNVDGTVDLKIPDNIKSIGAMAFGGILSATEAYSPFKNSNVYLPKNLEEYHFNSFGLKTTLNAVSDGTMYYLDDCIIAPVKISNPISGNYKLRNGTKLLPTGQSNVSVDWDNIWGSASYCSLDLTDTEIKKIPDYCFSEFMTLANIYLNNKISYVGNGAFNGCSSLLEINLPEVLNHIGDSAFDGCTKLEKFVVKTPADAELTVGATIFGASSKTARKMNVFADHPSILNYNFSGANITPTFYPAYQADWITLATPTISLDGATLNITPVEGAEQYEVEYAPLTNFDSIIPTVGQYVPYTTTSATTVDFSSMYSGTEAYYIRVRAISSSAFTSEYSGNARLQRRLATPNVALDGTTITITPVANATSYRIFNSSGTLLLDTTDLVVDLSEYQTTSSVSLDVKAYDSTGYYGMSASKYITLPALPAE